MPVRACRRFLDMELVKDTGKFICVGTTEARQPQKTTIKKKKHRDQA